jgi:hypothetical protein
MRAKSPSGLPIKETARIAECIALMLSAKAMSTGESDFSQEVERTLMKQSKTKGRRTGHIF